MIDDGSTDKTLDIALSYQKQYDFIKVIVQQNNGQASARNQGIRLAKGEWLIFIDADDFLYQTYFVELWEKMPEYSQSNVDIVRYQALMTGSENQRTIEGTTFTLLNCAYGLPDDPNFVYQTKVASCRTYLHNLAKIQWTAYVCLYMIRREFLLQHQIFFDESVKKLEDVLFVVQLFSSSFDAQIMEINLPIYIYRQHEHSTMGQLKDAPIAHFHYLHHVLRKVCDYWVSCVDRKQAGISLNQLIYFEVINLLIIFDKQLTPSEKIECQVLLSEFVTDYNETRHIYALNYPDLDWYGD